MLRWWRLLDGLLWQRAALANARSAMAECQDEARRRADAAQVFTRVTVTVPSPRDGGPARVPSDAV
ncbi:MAG: hypothetical protein ABR549_14685 [Mycobacteriales bacterium]